MTTEQREIPESLPRGGDVRGKRVVLTGASRGLGRLLAHAFSQAARQKIEQAGGHVELVG